MCQSFILRIIYFPIEEEWETELSSPELSSPGTFVAQHLVIIIILTYVIDYC